MKPLLLFIIMTLLVGCQSKAAIHVQPLQVTGQPFSEWINQEFRPIDPLTAYHSDDGSDTWTGWNTFWFASAVGGQAADTISTASAVNRGCTEANPLFGDNPSIGLVAGVKVAMLAGAWYTTEYWLAGDPGRQDARNWIYGALSITGFGAASWNSSQDCR